MNGAVAILAALAAVGGWLVLPNHDVFSALLAGAFPLVVHSQYLGDFNWLAALGTFALVAAGVLVAYAFYVVAPEWRQAVNARIAGLVALLRNAYYVDALYHALFEAPAYALGNAFARVFDPVAIGGIPRVVVRAATALGDVSRNWETGYLRRYGLSIAVGAAIVLYLILFATHAGAPG
jgi:NADH:ubiquinone oxidoreductase subunit 5 (subunit L)/multisubunit Na+/H+ antiporter MnhA subunit